MRVSLGGLTKKYAYKELNIFRQTMPSSGVTWSYIRHSLPKYIEFFVSIFFLCNHLVIPSFVIVHYSLSIWAFEIRLSMTVNTLGFWKELLESIILECVPHLLIHNKGFSFKSRWIIVLWLKNVENTIKGKNLVTFHKKHNLNKLYYIWHNRGEYRLVFPDDVLIKQRTESECIMYHLEFTPKSYELNNTRPLLIEYEGII
jgi:hypothetical protein